jgi:hypothetical protein
MSFQGALARILSVTLGLVALLLALNLEVLVAGMDRAEHWYESAGSFPLIAMGLVMLGAAGHLWSLRSHGDRALGDEEVEVRGNRIGVGLAGVALVALLVPAVLWLGFAPGLGLFALAVTRASGLPWRGSLVFSTLLAVILHLVFVKVFSIWFPQPWISGWLT